MLQTLKVTRKACEHEMYQHEVENMNYYNAVEVEVQNDCKVQTGLTSSLITAVATIWNTTSYSVTPAAKSTHFDSKNVCSGFDKFIGKIEVVLESVLGPRRVRDITRVRHSSLHNTTFIYIKQ